MSQIVTDFFERGFHVIRQGLAGDVHRLVMEPMLHPGDIVVIDRDDKIIVKNKMFAIYHEGGLTAKFLEKKTNLLILRPINPNAEIQIIDLNENPQPIVGKIIGAWKDL